MDVRKRLGAQMTARRAAKGWSQEELAHQSGLHRTYISGVERGVRNPTLTVLEKIALALDCQIGDLLNQQGTPAQNR